MSYRGLTLIVALLLTAPLQAQPSATAVAPRSRVEGGVTILEHDRDAFARAPRLALGPTIAVAGSSDSDLEYDLTWASSVAPLSDGRLATFSRVGNKLLIFGADGRPQRSLGRTGNGPGEFMAVGNMVLLTGDTLFLMDAANNRLNWVLADRGVVRGKQRSNVTARGADRAAGVLPGDRYVMFSSGRVRQGVRDSITRPGAPVMLLRDNAPEIQIAVLPDLETAMVETRYRGRSNIEARPIRFTRTAHVVVWDTLVATAVGDGYRVDLRNADGRIVSQLRVAVPRRPVTKTMRDAATAAELKRLHVRSGEGLVDPAESERLIREQPTADSLPPYGNIFVSPNKTLWVVDAVAPGDSEWFATAFRADGAIVGRLRGMGAAVPVAFGNDRVVLRAVDADDVVSFEIRRIGPVP